MLWEDEWRVPEVMAQVNHGGVGGGGGKAVSLTQLSEDSRVRSW